MMNDVLISNFSPEVALSSGARVGILEDCENEMMCLGL